MSTNSNVTITTEGLTRANKCILLAELQLWPTKSAKNVLASHHLLWPQRNRASLQQLTLNATKQYGHEMILATRFKIGNQKIETRYGEWLERLTNFEN